MACLASAAEAHPIPRLARDRTIEVRLTRDAVVVNYRLEVDEWTVVALDLPAVSDKVDLTRLSKPRDFYEAFTRAYAPILADNLTARLDGRPLPFTCVKQDHEVLDHLRCDFVFRAPWQPRPDGRQEFTFREGNYELEPGQVRVSLTGEAPLTLLTKTEPEEALKARPAAELRPGDTEALRKASATFAMTSAAEAAVTGSPPPEPEPETTPPRHNLLGLLLDSERGFWILLALAAGFGAAHALTPGHGKTLVAAYLVGERGTVVHALVLGLVTTLTHTGAVLILAAGLILFFPRAVPQQVQAVLGLGGGLLVAGMGFWLLLRRLSGGADHVHIGGHGHHHHGHGHHHADHWHDEHGHVHPLPPGQPVGWWGLVVLGMSGGIVPCWDAIAMFGFAVSAQRLWLGLPLLLAFSAGLASVLIAIGIAVVSLKGFAASHWGGSRLIRALPLVSAVLVTCLGLWLCYDSVHGGAAETNPAAVARER
jgi:ABC-type nickel/cobalt efflux system permease component RcnA